MAQTVSRQIIMEEKINGLIGILEFMVQVDTGLSRQHEEWVLEMLKELKEE